MDWTNLLNNCRFDEKNEEKILQRPLNFINDECKVKMHNWSNLPSSTILRNVLKIKINA